MDNKGQKSVVIIIPAYNPDEKFTAFLKDLRAAGYTSIITVNDGSREDTVHFFDEAEQEYGCKVLTHAVNLGQGRAYKTAFNYYLSETKAGGRFENTLGVVQCDCDGQHHIDDINRSVEYLEINPETFILGVRDFSDKSIPFRSRFGNNCTSFVFKAFCGLDLKDTQTGLKAIPKSFIPALMETPGERFEYASSVLLETKKQGVEILQFPIQTIYINGNETSHFNPLLDSIRIYSLILKYLMASLSAFIVDIVMFSIFLTITKGIIPDSYIIVSTYIAKVISCTYSFLVNKNLVFENHSKGLSTAFKYIILCIVQASMSAILTNTLVHVLMWNEVLVKIIVDTLLFFISFQIQNRWVFAKNGSKN